MNHRKFLSLLVLMAGIGCVRNSSQPDVFIIIIDTLRADHLSCYGYDRLTSPCIDSLAAEGTLFTRCQAQSPWTLPSHATIWTGLTPVSHQAGRRADQTYGLDSELSTIATILKDNGYITGGFVNVAILRREFGFANGFDHYNINMTGHGRAGETVDEVLTWLHENRGNPRPFLVVIHLFDPHSPYSPPPPFDTLFCPEGVDGFDSWEISSDGTILNPEDKDHFVHLYDDEIRWTDSQIGRLFSGLRYLGMADNSIIIITSDHGEEFLEHGYVGHGHTLFQELLHVPLIIAAPGVQHGVRDSSLTGQVDILPTLLYLLDIEHDGNFEGMNIISDQIPSDRSVFSSGCDLIFVDRCSLVVVDRENIWSLASVLQSEKKAIMDMRTLDGIMFDLTQDPDEEYPLTPDEFLQQQLEMYWTTPPLGRLMPVQSDDIDEQLRGLGYIR